MEPKKTLLECHIKSTKELVIEILEEYKVLFNLLNSNGFTGVDDNYRIRLMLNKIIHEIRRVQDFMIKISNKSKISNAITKKLENKNPRVEEDNETTLQPKADDCYLATSRSKTDEEIKDI
jgi:hypothetical protein